MKREFPIVAIKMRTIGVSHGFCTSGTHASTAQNRVCRFESQRKRKVESLEKALYSHFLTVLRCKMNLTVLTALSLSGKILYEEEEWSLSRSVRRRGRRRRSEKEKKEEKKEKKKKNFKRHCTDEKKKRRIDEEEKEEEEEEEEKRRRRRRDDDGVPRSNEHARNSRKKKTIPTPPPPEKSFSIIWSWLQLANKANERAMRAPDKRHEKSPVAKIGDLHAAIWLPRGHL